MAKIEGQHLWKVTYRNGIGWITFLITIPKRDPHYALRKASRVAKEQHVIGEMQSLKHGGTLDA